MKYCVVQAQDGTIVVLIEKTYSGGSLFINGKRMREGTYSYPGDKPVLLQRGNQMGQLQAIHPTRAGLPEIEPSAWEARKKELWGKRVDTGDYTVWACMDDKQAYDDFIDSYKPVYIDVEYLTEPKDIRDEAIPMLPDSEPYITPGYVMGEGLSTRFGVYNRPALWMAEIKAFAAQYELTESSTITGCRKRQYRVYTSSHRGEICLYVEGVQLFERRGISQVRQQVDKLIEVRDQDIAYLRRQFTLWASARTAVRDVMDAGELLTRLRRLQRQVAKIKPYRKSTSDWRAARSTAETLVDEVERILLQQKEMRDASIP
jgi:hypothetical protein